MTEKPVEHGTMSGWRTGCRCDPCVGANRAYFKAYRRDRKKRGTPLGRNGGLKPDREKARVKMSVSDAIDEIADVLGNVPGTPRVTRPAR